MQPIEELILCEEKDCEKYDDRERRKRQGREFREAIVRFAPLCSDETLDCDEYHCALRDAHQIEKGDRQERKIDLRCITRDRKDKDSGCEQEYNSQNGCDHATAQSWGHTCRNRSLFRAHCDPNASRR